MKLVVVTPYNTTNGQLLPTIARSDIATAQAGSFQYPAKQFPHEPVTVNATQVTLNNATSLFVQETVAALVAAS